MKKTYNPLNAYKMPFGVELLEGEIKFNIWAPDVDKMTLCLTSSNETKKLEMKQTNDGWYNLKTDLAKVGDKYSFELPDGLKVPDPASRYQPEDVHGPSLIINPESFDWEDDNKWKGLPWNEAVIYELHTGTFTKEGTYKAIIDKLDYLVSLGVTAIELLPVADFPGKRNWGYDGVLIYAPDSTYGTTEDLKLLIKTAHKKGLMVFLDVVYNHFGPDGNYLYCYAKSKFFDSKKNTPWGDAINFKNKNVRDFFFHNAIYWLEEYHFDGLRFDAIHAIWDESTPDFVEELAIKISEKFNNNKHIHLILENHGNEARYLKQDKEKKPVLHTAQWNDDLHHCLHVLLTGEKDGYYIDYTKEYSDKTTAHHLARSLSEGFCYQNEKSPYMNGKLRGESSKHLNPKAFINFIQNHDMVGNRAFGDRISEVTDIDHLKVAINIILLSPQIPMLFMGEEFMSSSPFLFFCDFGKELAGSVRDGRRKEFAKFPEFSDPKIRETIPDPVAEKTFKDSIIDWSDIEKIKNKEVLSYYKTLLSLRKKKIVPIIDKIKNSTYEMHSDTTFIVSWNFENTNKLTLLANLGNEFFIYNKNIKGVLLSESRKNLAQSLEESNKLEPWSVIWYIAN